MREKVQNLAHKADPFLERLCAGFSLAVLGFAAGTFFENEAAPTSLQPALATEPRREPKSAYQSRSMNRTTQERQRHNEEVFSS